MTEKLAPQPDQDRLRQVAGEIDRLGELAENFDGEGSPPISRANLEAAKALTANLYSAHGILCDEVFPTQMGGVEIEAESRYWELSIIVNDPERIEYLVKTGGQRKSGVGALIEIPGLIFSACPPSRKWPFPCILR